eukprot:5520662-Pyramimonas_sp.AAC.1
MAGLIGLLGRARSSTESARGTRNFTRWSSRGTSVWLSTWRGRCIGCARLVDGTLNINLFLCMLLRFLFR